MSAPVAVPPASRPQPAAIAAFAPRLLAWYGRHGRHDLPWHAEPTAYRVWVAEVMLQQTQVKTVIPYFVRFVAHFPDVRTLADAPLDQVLHHWSGLGYYARARNLQRAAQAIRDRHGGEFPADFESVVALPGIGRSTAGAILAQARGQRHPILDGNVKRVLARWFGIEGHSGEARVAAALWAASEAVTPAARAADWTQAIMDFGATFCTRTRPACALCPVAADCLARRGGRQQLLPTPRPAKARPRRRVAWLVLRTATAVLLERRPASGLWGGLWSFPEFADAGAARAHAAAHYGVGELRPWAPLTHAFSHFDLDVEPYVGALAATPGPPRAPGPTARGGPGAVADSDARAWYQPQGTARLGLAAPVAGLLAAVLDTAAAPGASAALR